MSLAQEYLALSRELIERNRSNPVQGDLRTAVTKAYYAIFHLLTQEAMDQLISDPDVRGKISRAFEHSSMKKRCNSYEQNAAKESNAADVPVLRDVARDFVVLQEARYEAEYDTSVTIELSAAEEDVERAEFCLRDWATVRDSPDARGFLLSLFLQSVIKNPDVTRPRRKPPQRKLPAPRSHRHVLPRAA